MSLQVLIAHQSRFDAFNGLRNLAYSGSISTSLYAGIELLQPLAQSVETGRHRIRDGDRVRAALLVDGDLHRFALAKVTGNLRDVMKESISAAQSLVRSRAVRLGIKPSAFNTTDIHVHVPDGATPKDGPSAGIAMTTAMVSLLTNTPVHRDIAMTGEVSLRGRVLPIGGLKEKLLAALRGGIKTVLIPQENEKDLADIPENVQESLNIIPVSDINEVLSRALVRPLTPIEWSEEDEEALAATLAGRPNPGGDSASVRH